MLKRISVSIFFVAALLFIVSCGKPVLPPPPIITTSKCFLVSETVNGGPGYGTSWVYKYDADGHLLKGSNPPVNGFTKDGQLAVSGNIIGISFSSASYSGTGKLLFVYGYAGDLKGGTPSSGSMDFTNQDGTGYPAFEQYIFGYDAKKRLIESSIKAGTISIQYDDNDNVVKMSFLTNNGPRFANPIITIAGYDDKLTPYAADPKIWKFTQQMMSWSYFSEYRMISALSKNNPGKITTTYVDDATSTNVDDITYQYDANKNPTQAIVQRTYRGKKTGYQTNFYGYECK